TALTSEVDYKSIEVPFGVKHYMFLNKKSSLFIDGLIIMDLSLNSKFDFKREFKSDLDIESGSNIALGFGYNYDRKFSVELRYHSSRDLLTNYQSWDSEYKTVSLLFGYTIF
ncbi:MAG: tRNA modification GTPase, partial [Salinimicrobium sp.]